MYKLFVTCMSIAVLTGCGQHKEQTRPTPEVERASAAVATLPVAPSRDEIAFQPCIELASKGASAGLAVSELGLQEAHRMVDCSETYLGNFPDGERVRDAGRLRVKALKAAMEILQALEQQIEAGTQAATGADAQAQLMTRENVKKLAVDNGRYLNRAINDQTIDAFRVLFSELKASGIKMANAQEALNAANLSRRRNGIWELTQDRSFDNGEFIVIGESLAGRRDANFAIAGYGSVWSTTQIRDTDFDSKGRFGSGCTVAVSAIGDSASYPCMDYLAGKANASVISTTKKQLLDDMRKKAASDSTQS